MLTKFLYTELVAHVINIRMKKQNIPESKSSPPHASTFWSPPYLPKDNHYHNF